MEKVTPKNISDALVERMRFYKAMGWEVDSDAVNHYLTDYIMAVMIAVRDGYIDPITEDGNEKADAVSHDDADTSSS